MSRSIVALFFATVALAFGAGDAPRGLQGRIEGRTYISPTGIFRVTLPVLPELGGEVSDAGLEIVDVAPLDIVPVASPPVSARAAGGTNASPPLAGANGDFIVKPMPLVPGSLRSALRGSTVGCDNRNAVALNKAERSVCDDRIGVRGANAPYIPVGTELGRDDRRDFDTQADLARRLREWKAAQAPPGTGASETGINGLGPAKPKATP